MPNAANPVIANVMIGTSQMSATPALSRADRACRRGIAVRHESVTMATQSMANATARLTPTRRR
jgi:hypothetical protein